MQSTTGPNVSELDKGVWEAHNQVRTDPKNLVPDLEEMLTRFNGNVLQPKTGNCGLRTNEGPAAVQEAIEFLNSCEPLPALKWSDLMWQAAVDHTNDTGPKGLTGHDGSDGSSSSDRLTRHGQWLSTCGENISYGNTEARGVLIQLIVDDGVPSRGHRKNIFSSAFGVMGCSSGPHKVYSDMTCITYAGGFAAKGEDTAAAMAQAPKQDGGSGGSGGDAQS